MTKKTNNVLTFTAMGLVVLIWLYLFRDFWFYRIRLFDDGLAYYGLTKYFLDNFLRGVYPLWDPLENLGMPDSLNLRFLGEFNPLLLISAFFYKLGLPFDRIYFIHSVGYYLLGLVGFYKLSRIYFEDRYWALVSFTFLLFSSSSLALFFNYCEIVLFVPAVWFFCFLLSFHQNSRKHSFLGMTICLMIIMVTYMPFYFVTVFGCLIVVMCLFHIREFKNFIRALIGFINTNRMLALLSVAGVLLACVPGALWYLESRGEEMIMAHRGLKSAGTHAANVSINMVNVGSIIGPVTLKRIFSGLAFRTNELTYFFLPFLAYPILFVSLVNPIKKRGLVLLFSSVVIFLITLADATPVHKFLYDHVFFFKMMRNIFYLLYLALPVMVLFIVEQWRVLVEEGSTQGRRRILLVFFTVVVHGLMGRLLSLWGEIIVTSYLTIGLSCLIFIWAIYETSAVRKKLLRILFLGLIIIHPVQVFSAYCDNLNKGQTVGYLSFRQKPIFSFKRSKDGESRLLPEVAFPESPGSTYKFSGTYWTYEMLKQQRQGFIEDYLLNKFIVYDTTERMNDQDINWPRVREILTLNRNIAFVSEDVSRPEDFRRLKRISPQAAVIKENSHNFQVIDFDLNFIKFRTNYKSHKFVVYNDSYHPLWQAYLNNAPIKIHKANVAFKGFWLPPGENFIYMRFGQRWRYGLVIVIFACFYGFFGFFIWQWMMDVRRTKGRFDADV